LTAEAARHLQHELDEIEAGLRAVNRGGFDAMREMTIFEREAPPGHGGRCQKAAQQAALAHRAAAFDRLQ
jgi:hypothetical protein